MLKFHSYSTDRWLLLLELECKMLKFDSYSMDMWLFLLELECKMLKFQPYSMDWRVQNGEISVLFNGLVVGVVGIRV